MTYDVVRKLIRAVGLIVASAIGLFIPLAFGMLDFMHLQRLSQSEADFHADYISRMTELGTIRFSSEGLQGIVSSVAATSQTNARLRILDEKQHPLLEWGAKFSGPSNRAVGLITLGGEDIGSVEVTNPVEGLLQKVALLLATGALLGVIAYLAVTAIPVQALADASRQIERQQQELGAKNAQLDAALTHMIQGVCLYDPEQRIVIANRRYAEIYGLSDDEVKPGTSLHDVLEARVKRDVYEEHEAREIVELGLLKFRESVSEILTLKDGRHISVLRRPLADGGLISTHEDVTERKRADALITHMAMHDVLTGLPNRSLLRERLERTLPRVSEGNIVALHCLDLDRFKAVNDTLGHPIGDALLKSVAERLQGCVRGSDLVVRLGGDEFAILQTALAEPGQAAILAERLIASLSEPFQIEDHRVSIGASVGIAVSPTDGTDGITLLKNADLALYCSKSDGRGRYCFFERDMDAKIQARRLLELDLQSALSLNQFELHYQPLVDLKTTTVVAMEALLRWNHPVRGSVPPSDFIPVVEEIGLIESLGRWVIQKACVEAATWPDDISVSVNISPHQFKSNTLAMDVAAALASAGLSAHRLELEITESALMQNTASTLDVLGKIRTLGVKVAMDDFGTGYSSLSYLHAFPFDKIKIDKCFVQSLSEKKESAHILRAVVDLGTNLKMVTTAEGVETAAQLQQLRNDGCTQVQGYYFSPPRPATEIPALLRRLSRRDNAA
jgi:diguanylate cyclase (GGDEF)-like protein/PAS domain S-box-containing protein